MAETFKNQVDALTGFAGTEDDALTDWLQAGTREVINILPPHLKEYCYSKQTFTSAAADSESETMITGQLGGVFAGSVECRQIRPMDKHKASSSTSIEYASATDPVYYIEGNKINILPASSSGVYYVIANPTVAHGSTSIDNFPNEAEYLVTLYASTRALQRLMNNMNSVTAIDSTALGAITAEILLAKYEAAELAAFTDSASGSSDFNIALTAINTAVDKFRGDSNDPGVFGNEDTYNTVDSRMTLVKDALDNAQTLFDTDLADDDGNRAESVLYWLNDEDTEMVSSTVSAIGAEISRAQALMAEWNVAVQTLQAEISGYSTEVQSRVAFCGAKGQTIEGHIKTAQGYIAEAKVRMEREGQKYQWYQAQQAKLQQDYDKGIQMLITGAVSQPKEERSK